MNNILVLGAGKSSHHLINYLLDNASTQNWFVTVGDFSLEAAQAKVQNHPHAKAIRFDINDEQNSRDEIKQASIVVSLLPPALHHLAAVECLNQNKNLVTASYVSQQMQAMHDDVKNKGLLFLNECGLDPGLDHMSAMKIIDELKSKGAELISFKSFTGGLIAPECNDNPWEYKFTWNPRNVILAGQGTACFLESGQYRFLPYNRLFLEIEPLTINEMNLEGYANRDSLKYRNLYNIPDIPNILRGTLRYKGFCKAWNIFVQLGLTDDTNPIEDSGNMTYRQLMDAMLPGGNSIEVKLWSFIGEHTNDASVLEKIKWTGLLDNKKIPLQNATPAQILQNLLEQKWKLNKNDLDLIIMQHQFIYVLNQVSHSLTSTFIAKGENSVATAMSKTVGLPLGIAAKNILNGTIKTKGVAIPVEKEIYNPILSELKNFEINFVEE